MSVSPRRERPTLRLKRPVDAEETAKELILRLVRANGGRLTGKKRLYKAFWRANLLHVEATGRDLTTWPIVRMPHGPGIDEVEKLVCSLVEEGRIAWQIGEGSLTKMWILESKDNVQRPMDEDVDRAVSGAIDFIRDKTEDQLSEDSHLVGWYEATMGQPQEPSLDLVKEDEYDQNRRAFRKQERRFVDLFEAEDQGVAA